MCVFIFRGERRAGHAVDKFHPFIKHENTAHNHIYTLTKINLASGFINKIPSDTVADTHTYTHTPRGGLQINALTE